MTLDDDALPIDTSVKQNTRRNYFKRLYRSIFPLSFLVELNILLRLHIPTFLTAFLLVFIQFISVLMCGHYLTVEEMDAVALASSFINTFGIGVGTGLASGCDTFFAQTYGSENKKRIGVILQRSMIIMFICFMLVCSFMLNLRPVLPFLGQDKVVSEMASQYVAVFVPGLFGHFMFIVFSRYLQAQNLVNPPTVCVFIANVLNIVSQYILVGRLGHRFIAVAVCQVVSLVVMNICLLGYILISKVYVPTWSGWSLESLTEFGGYLKIGIPGIFYILSEFGSFELGLFIMGTVDTIQLGAQAVILNCTTLTYMISLGLSVAVTIRIGQHMGCGSIEGAKHTYKVSMVLAVSIAIVVTILYAVLKRHIAQFFTKNQEIVDVAIAAFTCYSVFPFVDGIAATTIGVLKGCGRQVIATLGNFIAFFVIALPLGVPLALFTYLETGGLWVGLLFGIASQCVLFIIVIARMDWDKQVASAQKRSGNYTDNVVYSMNETIEILDQMKEESNLVVPDDKIKTEPNVDQDVDKAEAEPNSFLINDSSNNVQNENLQMKAATPSRKLIVQRLSVGILVFLCLIASIISYFFQTPLVDLAEFYRNHSLHLSVNFNKTFNLTT